MTVFRIVRGSRAVWTSHCTRAGAAHRTRHRAYHDADHDADRAGHRRTHGGTCRCACHQATADQRGFRLAFGLLGAEGNLR